MQVRLHSVLYWPDEDKCISKQIVKGRCPLSAETKLWHLVRNFFWVKTTVCLWLLIQWCWFFSLDVLSIVLKVEQTGSGCINWRHTSLFEHMVHCWYSWIFFASTAVITFVLASFVKGFDCVCSETLYYFWMQSFLLQSLSCCSSATWCFNKLYTILSFLCVCRWGGGGGDFMVLQSNLFLFNFTRCSLCVIPVLLTL